MTASFLQLPALARGRKRRDAYKMAIASAWIVTRTGSFEQGSTSSLTGPSSSPSRDDRERPGEVAGTPHIHLFNPRRPHMGSAHQNNVQLGQSLTQILTDSRQRSQRTRFCLMEARIQRGLPPGSHLRPRPLGPQGAWQTLKTSQRGPKSSRPAYLRLFPHCPTRAPARNPDNPSL